MTEPLENLLSLAAQNDVAAALLDPRRAWLWAEDGERILIANPAGAAAFNKRGLLADHAIAPGNPAARQIAHLARAIPVGGERIAIVRIAFGLRLEALVCFCKRVRIGGGMAILAIAARTEPFADLRHRAEKLVAAFAAKGGDAALFDETGRIVASTDSLAFAGLPISQGSGVERRAVEVLRARRVLSTVRLETQDGVFLLAHLGTAGVGAADVEAPPPLSFSPPDRGTSLPSGLTRGSGSADAGVRVSPADGISDQDVPPPAIRAASPFQGERNTETADAALPPDDEAPGPSGEPTSSDERIVSHTRPRERVEHPPTKEAPPAPAEPFRFVPGAAPVRFVFAIDAEERIVSVSPEFTGAVGPGAAAIVGERWPDVAARLGVDPEGSVARALARHDTWSGITLFWPVDGANVRIAVDLAALPAFNRDRTFQGFRGFGVCRSSDIRPALIAIPPEDEADTVAEPIPADDEEPSPASAAPTNGRSNIVRLLTGAPVRSAGPLSGNEQDAFQRIAEALGAALPGERTSPTSAERPAVPRVEPVETAAPSSPAEDGAQPVGPGASPDIRLLDRIPTGILVMQGEEPVYANQTFLDLVGFPTARAFAAAGGLATVFDEPGGGEGDGRRILRRRDGSRVEVETRLRKTPWVDGTALMLTFAEIEAPVASPSPVPLRSSARIEDLASSATEAEAARTEQLWSRLVELEAILDTATDGVLVLDGEGTIVSLNRSAEAVFGVNSSDVAGKNFTALLAEESHRLALDYLDGLAENGVASVLNDGREVIGKVPRGGLIPLFMTMGRVGATGKFCVVLRDITQWKNAEEDLTAARHSAEAANAQKSEFLAKVSHEIRTPLNAVIGFSEVMMEERFGPIGNERYREYLRDIHLSGSHLMSLINDLLDLSKIEAGKLELTFEAVAVNEIIQESVALMQPQANRERIIIRTSLASGMPNVVADPRSLRQIVLNLLSNAIKFTLPGGQVIVSSALEENGEVVVRIRDTGVGMSEKDIESALKPFRQVAVSGRHRFDGTGLGLPLTKALVEANRAGFAIDSVVNQGTLVRVTFPNTRVLAG